MNLYENSEELREVLTMAQNLPNTNNGEVVQEVLLVTSNFSFATLIFSSINSIAILLSSL